MTLITLIVRTSFIKRPEYYINVVHVEVRRYY